MQEKAVHFWNCVGLMNSDFDKGILFYSGFFGDKDESSDLFKDFIPFLHESGFSTLRFDMSGLGESEKDLREITFQNWLRDSSQALEFLDWLGHLAPARIRELNLGYAHLADPGMIALTLNLNPVSQKRFQNQTGLKMTQGEFIYEWADEREMQVDEIDYVGGDKVKTPMGLYLLRK